MKSTITIAALVALLASTASAFNTKPLSSRQRVAVGGRTKLGALGPEHINDLHSILSDTPAWSFLADAAQATLDPSAVVDGASLTDIISQDLDVINQDIQNIDQAVEKAAEITAEIAQDEGWWKAYLNIFKSALLFIHDKIDGPLRSVGFEQTWGVSIALFTASVRSLLLPISLQQSKSSEYIKALKPYVNDIKAKYKDQDQQNKAIGKLYEDAEQNPLAGCFVSLAQLPVFLGLYRGVRLLAQDGKIDEPFLWIPSLQGPVSPPDFRDLDWLTQGWSTIDGTLTPPLGWETTLAFLAMPIILVLGQSFTMNVLQPPIDDDMSDEEKEQMEKSQVVLKFLPLLIGFFSLQVPAGLTIYWFTSNSFTLLQSLGARAYYKANPPKIELPDYWSALDQDVDDMSAEDKRKAAKAGIAVGPSWDEILDEAKFHILVERKPLREGSAAWDRAMQAEEIAVPALMESWVGTDKLSFGTKKESETSFNTTDLEPAVEAV